MYEQNLQLLRILLEATQRKDLVWRNDSTSGFHARFAGLRCQVRFEFVPTDGDRTIEFSPLADYAEITVGLASLKFYSGTEGFSLAQEMIAAAYPQLQEEYLDGQKQMDDLLNRLRNPNGVSGQKPIP